MHTATDECECNNNIKKQNYIKQCFHIWEMQMQTATTTKRSEYKCFNRIIQSHCRVAHAAQRGKYTGPLFSFFVGIRITHKWKRGGLQCPGRVCDLLGNRKPPYPYMAWRFVISCHKWRVAIYRVCDCDLQGLLHRYPSWCDLRCCREVKLQQSTKHLITLLVFWYKDAFSLSYGTSSIWSQWNIVL